MCRIDINITSMTTKVGTTINTSSIYCRYREQGTITWSTPSLVSFNSPQTPEISDVGTYEIQLSVSNSVGENSGWSDSAFFNVSNDCGSGLGYE